MGKRYDSPRVTHVVVLRKGKWKTSRTAYQQTIGGRKMKLNTVYNEDCMEGMKRIPDKSVKLIVTDPPYLHVKGGMKSKVFNGKTNGTWRGDSHMVTKMSDFDKDKIFQFLDLSLQKMEKANMFIFCSKLQLVHYFEYISQHKKLKYDLLVWDKVKYSMKSTKFYTSDIEYVVRIYQAGVSLNKILVEDGSKSDINYYLKRQSFAQPKGSHGTMKPTGLIERFIRVASKEDDVVLDPFMGSGTTAIACLNTDRQYIGFELDETYHKLSLERIENHTPRTKERKEK